MLRLWRLGCHGNRHVKQVNNFVEEGGGEKGKEKEKREEIDVVLFKDPGAQIFGFFHLVNEASG